jgi:hypothetical protein
MKVAAPEAPTARPLHEICEAARRLPCRICGAQPSQPCTASGTGPDGLHMGRLAWAEALGVISAADFKAALDVAGPFNVSTIVYVQGRPLDGPVTFTAAQAAVIRQALADAEVYRRKRASDWCDDCATSPAQACSDHLDDLDQADAFRAVAAELAGGGS